MIVQHSNQAGASNRHIPLKGRSLYKKAMTGKSRKAAMHAFCLECCAWEIKEVFACTDPGCPLYPYRPTSRISQSGSQGHPQRRKSKKSGQLALCHG